MESYKVARLLLVLILFVSTISLIVVYQSSYIAELHLAKALPLSVVVGLTTIAVAIVAVKEKN